MKCSVEILSIGQHKDVYCIAEISWVLLLSEDLSVKYCQVDWGRK